jgi:hypothetical protein
VASGWLLQGDGGRFQFPAARVESVSFRLFFPTLLDFSLCMGCAGWILVLLQVTLLHSGEHACLCLCHSVSFNLWRSRITFLFVLTFMGEPRSLGPYILWF